MSRSEDAAMILGALCGALAYAVGGGWMLAGLVAYLVVSSAVSPERPQ